MRFPRHPLAPWTGLVLVPLAVGATVVAVVVTFRGPGFSFAGSTPGGYVTLVGPAVLCLGATLSRLWRHPDRFAGPALVAAAGIAWVLAEWDNPAAGSAVVFSVGLACFAVAPAIVLHAGLAGGRGRLDGWFARLLVAVGYAVTLGVQGVLPATIYDPASSGCPSCPDNLWHVGGDDGSTATLDRLGVVVGLAWSAVATAAVIWQVARASPARRRAEGPRWVPAAAYLGLTVASYVHSLDRGFLGADVFDRRLWVAQGVALAAVALGVVAELARERAAERALARVVVDLSGAEGSLRAALAERLGDPDLVLAFPVDQGSGLVDARARPVAVAHGHERVVTPLSYGGHTLATLEHRRGVLGSVEAVDDLVAAIHLGLEHERLQAEALAQVDALRASGVRLVETGDDERRRLERDLHDGAQQRLVGLALGLRLLAARAAPSERLMEAERELQAAIDDLRALARGLAPLVLTDAGLAAALRALAESRPLRVLAAPTGRYPHVVEATAYAAVERASEASPASVSMVGDRSTLTVRVSVTGALPDLGDLPDRATTLGGVASIVSSGGSHEVVVTLPIAAPSRAP